MEGKRKMTKVKRNRGRELTGVQRRLKDGRWGAGGEEWKGV